MCIRDSYNTMDTEINRLGAVVYQGHNGAGADAKNYPFDYGPRLGIAYQLNSKTVLRGGAGLVYGTTSNNAELSLSVADFYTFNGPGYGIADTVSYTHLDVYKRQVHHQHEPCKAP